MHFIVLFTLFPGLTLALLIHENVVFQKANKITITRSNCFSTFMIELKPYENFSNKMSEDLGKAKITAHSIDQFYDCYVWQC